MSAKQEDSASSVTMSTIHAQCKKQKGINDSGEQTFFFRGLD